MTEKEIERMLLPRFEVIADYPHSPYKVGQIIDGEEGILIGTYYYDYEAGTETFEEGGNLFSQYPHLFREIPWWEGLALSEMPEYLKLVRNGQIEVVRQVHDWAGLNWKRVPICRFYNEAGQLTNLSVSGMLPATEAEYEKGKTKN